MGLRVLVSAPYMLPVIERFQPILLIAVALMVAIEFIPDRVARKVAKKRAAMRGEMSTVGGQ